MTEGRKVPKKNPTMSFRKCYVLKPWVESLRLLKSPCHQALQSRDSCHLESEELFELLFQQFQLLQLPPSPPSNTSPTKPTCLLLLPPPTAQQIISETPPKSENSMPGLLIIEKMCSLTRVLRRRASLTICGVKRGWSFCLGALSSLLQLLFSSPAVPTNAQRYLASREGKY